MERLLRQGGQPPDGGKGDRVTWSSLWGEFKGGRRTEGGRFEIWFKSRRWTLFGKKRVSLKKLLLRGIFERESGGWSESQGSPSKRG